MKTSQVEYMEAKILSHRISGLVHCDKRNNRHRYW